MDLGINLSFALKRWPEPAAWARLVGEELGLGLVQFSLDLLDPWWPQPERAVLAAEVRRAAADHGLTIHSAQLGLAWYSYNGLLAPSAAERAIAREWWKRAAETGAELGVNAIGGPLGAFSVATANDPDHRRRRYEALLDDVVAASEAAATAGLGALLVEPTPIPREIPSSVEETRRLLDDLAGRVAVPISLVLDVGHALYRPLYGPDVTLESWLAPLAGSIAVLHLQNHDFQSDAHHGWPDERGSYDVVRFGSEVRAILGDAVPVVIELFFPFELADEDALRRTRETVAHCRAALA